MEEGDVAAAERAVASMRRLAVHAEGADVTAEAIQLHGGIGATDDLDIGLFYKRARACELTFGDAAYHRDRFGQLQGY